MAISHACPVCGAALTRVSAGIDPVYGMPLVSCRACGTSLVRRRHPVAQFVRGVRRARGSGGALAVRALMLALLIAGSLGIAAALREAFSEVGPVELVRAALQFGTGDAAVARWVDAGGRWWVMGAACWFGLVGGVLGGALSHIRARWRVYAGFVAATGAVMGVFVAGEFFSNAVGSADGLGGAFGRVGWREWGGVGLALACGLAVSGVLGWPLGRVIRASRRHWRARAWRRLLTRTRKRRRLA